MEKDTQNGQHATAQGEIIESKTGSMPELGGPTHPSLFGTFQDLRLKVPCPRKFLSPRQAKIYYVGKKK